MQRARFIQTRWFRAVLTLVLGLLSMHDLLNCLAPQLTQDLSMAIAAQCPIAFHTEEPAHETGVCLCSAPSQRVKTGLYFLPGAMAQTCFTQTAMNPKPIFGKLQAAGNDNVITALALAQSTVFVGGYLKDPTLSPVVPVGSNYAFIGSFNSGTMTWNWLLVDPLSAPKTKVMSINKSGSYLLVAVDKGGDSQLYMLQSVTGMKGGSSTIVLSGWAPIQNAALFLGSTKAIFILKNNPNSMVLELDMSKWWATQSPTARTLKDSNNSLDMHFLAADPNFTYFFIAYTSTQSDTVIPTTSLPGVIIEMIKISDFTTAKQFALHCALFGTGSTVYPMVAHMLISGGYTVSGALTVKDPTSSLQQHLFRFQFGNASPFSIQSSNIAAIQCRSILSSFIQSNLYYLVDVASGLDSKMHIVSVDTSFTTISSTLVATLTNLSSPVWNGSALMTSTTLAIFSAQQQNSVKRGYVYQTDATLKDQATCAIVSQSTGTVAFVASTTFVAPNFFGFAEWNAATMSYSATHITGNQGTTGLTAVDKFGLTDIAFFQAVQLGSQFCNFATTFTVTAPYATTTEYIYQLDTGGIQSFALQPASITSTTCGDQTANLFYEVTSITPPFPAGVLISFTGGASPTINLICAKTVIPSGPYTVQIGVRLSNGQVFPRQTLTVWLNSLLCEQTVVPKTYWAQQNIVLAVTDVVIDMAPYSDLMTQQCTATIKMISAVRTWDLLPAATGLFTFIDLTSQTMLNIQYNCKLNVWAKTVPYTLANSGIHKITMEYKIGMKTYNVEIQIYLQDPCETVSATLNPPWDYKGGNSWVMSSAKTVNDFAVFNLVMPVGFEFCIFDPNSQLTLNMPPAYIVPANKQMPFLIEIQTTVYNQAWIDNQGRLPPTQYCLKLGSQTACFAFDSYITDRCSSNFKIGQVPNTISFWGDPQLSAYLFRSIEKSPYQECLLWVVYEVKRITGGTTVPAGFITLPPITKVNRSVYYDAEVVLNYSITTIADVGQYNVTVNYAWEEECDFTVIPGGNKNYYTFIVYVEDKVQDPCMVLIKPRQNETEKICINTLNRPSYVYPYASIYHPECLYNLQMQMSYEGGPYGPVSNFAPFIATDLTNMNYGTSLQGKVECDFASDSDKTKQGVYTVKIDIQWASGVSSATYYKYLEVWDCCGFEPGLGGVKVSQPSAQEATITKIMEPGPFKRMIGVIGTTEYANCAMKKTISVTKTPAIPDTRSVESQCVNCLFSMTYKSQVGIPPPKYDWDNEGTYQISVDYWWVSNNMYVTTQDYGQNVHWTQTVIWIDPCLSKTIPPVTIPNLVVPLSSAGFPAINPTFEAAFMFCHCSINISVTKGGVAVNRPDIFVYPGLTKATVKTRLATQLQITPPYDLTLLGIYVVKVDYQWSRVDFATRTFNVEFIDPCIQACSVPLLPSIIPVTGWNQVFQQSVAFNIMATFQMCLYTIKATFTKTPALPNTIPTTIVWTDMINKGYNDFPNANINFDTTYDPNKVGNYVVSLTYQWGQPLQTVLKTFTAQLLDECLTCISTADKTATYYIGSPDTTFVITPQWVGTQSFCKVDMMLASTKNSSPDTSSGMFTWTSTITQGTQGSFDTNPITVKSNAYTLANVGVYTFTMNISWGNPTQIATMYFVFTVLDGCATFVTPPTASTKTRNLLDPDNSTTQINAAPSMVAPYGFCKYNILGVITKTTTPDTSVAVISWVNMIGATSVDLPNAIVHYIGSTYTLANLGTYTIQLTYQYGGATWTNMSVVKTWTMNVIDPCLAAVVPPTPVSYTFYVKDPDFVVNLAPTIDPVYQNYCLYSIVSMTCAKTQTPDTCTNVYSGFAPQINVIYTAIPTQKQTLVISPEIYENIGTYTFTIIYNWGGTGNTTTITKTFTLLLKNPCSDIGVGGVLSYPARTNLVVNLLDANTVLDVTPTIAPAYNFCAASVEITRTKDGAADATTLLSTWVDKINQAIITIQGLKLTFTHNTYDLSLVGVYSIVLKYTAYGGLTSQLPFTFTVIDPCIAAVVPPSPGAETWFTTDPNVVRSLSPTVTLAYQPYCKFSISLTITKSTSPDTSTAVHNFTPVVDILFANVALATVTYIPLAQDLSLVGVYTLTFKYDWGGAGHVTTLNKVVTFTIKNPCLESTTGKMTIPTRTNLTGQLVDPNTVLNVKPTMTVIGYEWCLMTIIATITKGGSPIADGFVTWTNQTNLSVSALTGTQFTFNTSAYIPAYIGVYTIALTYTWSDPTPITRTFTFTVVDPCATAVIPPDPTTIPNYGPVKIGNPSFVQTLAPTVALPQQPYCTYSISMVATKQSTPNTSATAISFTPQVNVLYASVANSVVTYNIATQDTIHAGIYDITITWTWGGTGADFSASHSFTLTLDDPCLSNMIIPTFTSTSAYLSDPNTSFSVAPTMSITGYEWCPVNIVLTLTKGGLPNADGFVTWTDRVNASVTSLATSVILFNTSTYVIPYLGVYDVSLRFTWSTATPVVRTFTFTVNDPCPPAITPPASIPNYTAMIGTIDYTQTLQPTISVAMQPYCPFTITMVSTKAPLPDTTPTAIAFGPVVNVKQANIATAKVIYNCSIQNLTHAGTYNIEMTYTWAGAPVMTTTLSFVLTLQDPCLTYMTIPTYANLIAFLVDPNTSLLVKPTMTTAGFDWCLVSIVATVTKGGVANSDGFVAWTNVVTQPLSSLTTTSIQFNHASYVPAYVGVYNIDLKYDWSGPSTITKSFTFTVVDPCILNNVPPATLPNYTAYVGDPDYIQDIAITVGVPYQAYCLYSITLTSVKITTPDTSSTAMTYTNMVNSYYTDLPNAKITYNVSVPDLAEVGMYNLSVLYEWGGQGQVTSAKRTMVLTLQDPCLAFMVIPTYVSTTALLLDPDTSLLLTPTIVPANSAYEFCWVSIFLIVNKEGVPNSDGFVAFTQISVAHLYDIYTDAITFNTSAYTPAYVGVYQLDLFYQWSGPSSAILSFTFTVVDPCILNNVPPTTLPNYTAYIGDPNYLQDIAMTVNAAYQDYCLFSISLTKQKQILPDTSSTAITYINIMNQYYQALPAAKIQFNVSIPDLAHTGVYDLTVLYQWGGVGNVASSSVPFTLTLQDPCKVFMVIPTYVNMVGTLLDPNYTALVTPTISSPNYLFCTVTIQMAVTKAALPNNDGFAAFTGIIAQQLAVIGGTFVTFNTEFYMEPFIGVYSISLTFTWSGPSTSTQLFTFTVIDPCIAAVIPPASIPNSAWWIGDLDQSQSFPPSIDPVFQDYCIYSISITVTKNIAPNTSALVVTFTPMVNKTYLNNSEAIALFDVSTPDLNNTGIYTIVVTYQWGGFGTDTSQTRTFSIELQDPCKAFLTPPTFLSMSGILLDPKYTTLVTPTISSPNYMFCTVTIAMTVTKNAAVDSSPFAEFVTITNQQLAVIGSNKITFHTDAYIYSYVGIYTVSLAYSWSGPSTSTQVFTFEVIDPCIIEVAPPVIPDATIEFKPDPFSVTYVEIQPTILPIYAPYCFFDIAVTQSKNSIAFPADTFVLFADMLQAAFLTNPVIQIGLIDGYYDISLFGIWTIDVKYSWNGPSTQTQTFVITYVPPPDPCFLAIAPPLTIASLTNWLSDPNFTVDVNPTVDPAHPECLFNISMSVTKNPTLYDTAADVLTFQGQVGATLADLPNFIVSHWPELLIPERRGVYTISIKYTWFTYVTRNYDWTLNDPCPEAITTPLGFANQVLQLNKLDQTLNVSAFISQPQFKVCLHSINVVVQKTGVSVSTLSNMGNPMEFNQINSLDFFVAGVNLITYKTDSTVNYDPSFQGLYDVFVQYRWAEVAYPAPTIFNLSFKVEIIDPCVTELTTPVSFPNKTMTWGDQPNAMLDISVFISGISYDFCVYDLIVDSSQAGSFNKASLVQFNTIARQSVLNRPTAVMTFGTFATFWDPDSSGNFTMTINYHWSLSNQFTINFNLEVINPCFTTMINSYLVRDFTVEVGGKYDVEEVPQVTDTVGKQFGPLSTCGLRVYTIEPTKYKFLNFTESVTQMDLNLLSVGTDVDKDQGKYVFKLTTTLASFPKVASSSTLFTVFINRRPVNRKPTFIERLPEMLTIQMKNYTDSEKELGWFFELPEMFDLDGDQVSISINWGKADTFMKLNDRSIQIKDIREFDLNPIKSGFYPLFIKLSDKKETNSYMLPITVYPATQSSNSTLQSEEIDLDKLLNMQKLMDHQSYLAWLASLVKRRVISGYEEYLMSFIDEDDPMDWAYRVLNETGNFTEYDLFGWSPGNFWENMTEQSFMDEVRKEIIDWRTAVAVKRTFDREMMPPGWLMTKTPPRAYFRQITDTGFIKIGFTEKVYIVPDMRMVNNGTIYMNELQMLGDYKRELIWQREADQRPCLELQIIPGEGQNPKLLNFTWNATVQDYEFIDIQVYFDNPEVVSTGFEPDKLRVRFNDPMLFLGVNGHVIDKQTRVIEKFFKRQAPRTIQIEHQIWETTAKVAQVAVLANFVLNILISAALNQMWSMIETQQLIIFLLLFEISMPANAMAFFSQLMAIAAFDFVNVEPWTNWLFQLNSTGALNDKYEEMGMGSIYFVNNLGSFGIIFLIYLVFLVSLPCLGYKCCRKIPILYYNKKAIRNHFKWGFLISAIRESSAIIAICVFINFKKIKWEYVGDYFHNSIALIFLCVICVFPYYCIWYIYMNWRIVERESMERKRLMDRFGMWIEDLNLGKGRIVLLQPAFYVFRRIHLAITCVYMKWFIGQTFMMMFQIIFSIIMVGYIQPWENPHQWKYQLGNEFLLLLVYYHMMCFTPFFPDMSKQWWLGYSIVGVVAAHLIWSMLYIFFVCFKQLCWKTRLWFALRHMRRQLPTLKEFYAQNKLNRRKRRSEWEKQLKKLPIVNLLEEEKEESPKKKKEKLMLSPKPQNKTVKKNFQNLSAIQEVEDDFQESGRRNRAEVPQMPVNGIFASVPYRNPILDLFDNQPFEPEIRVNAQISSSVHKRQEIPSKSKSPRKQIPKKNKEPKKNGLNELFELGQRMDAKYKTSSSVNENQQFSKPKPFIDQPAKGLHRTQHGLQELIRMEREQFDMGLRNVSPKNKQTQNSGWVIDGQRSKPVSDKKWKELSKFQFNDLIDNDSNSAVSALNLQTDFELQTNDLLAKRKSVQPHSIPSINNLQVLNADKKSREPAHSFTAERPGTLKMINIMSSQISAQTPSPGYSQMNYHNLNQRPRADSENEVWPYDIPRNKPRNL